MRTIFVQSHDRTDTDLILLGDIYPIRGQPDGLAEVLLEVGSAQRRVGRVRQQEVGCCPDVQVVSGVQRHLPSEQKPIETPGYKITNKEQFLTQDCVLLFHSSTGVLPRKTHFYRQTVLSCGHFGELSSNKGRLSFFGVGVRSCLL